MPAREITVKRSNVWSVRSISFAIGRLLSADLTHRLRHCFAVLLEFCEAVLGPVEMQADRRFCQELDVVVWLRVDFLQMVKCFLRAFDIFAEIRNKKLLVHLTEAAVHDHGVYFCFE